MNTETTPIQVTQAASIAEQAHQIALSVEIDSPEMYQMAAVELQGITAKQQQLEDLRFSLTRPLDESKKRIMQLFDAPKRRLEEAINLLRTGMTTYQNAEREKALKLQQEADEADRRERARLAEERRQADSLAQQKLDEAARLREEGNTTAAAEAEQAAEQAAADSESASVALEVAEVAPARAATVTVPKVAGVSTRQTWKAEVLDLHALIIAAADGLKAGDPTLAAYVAANESALGMAAKALRGAGRIPGVRIYVVEGLAVRKTR